MREPSVAYREEATELVRQLNEVHGLDVIASASGLEEKTVRMFFEGRGSWARKEEVSALHRARVRLATGWPC